MEKFLFVYEETVQLTRTVEADSLKAAWLENEHRAEQGWEDCDETTLGTDGDCRIFDENGVEIDYYGICLCGAPMLNGVCSVEGCVCSVKEAR